MRIDRGLQAHTSLTGERVLEGLGVSGGVVVGPAHVIETGFQQVPEYRVPDTEIDHELDRVQSAVAKALRQLRKLKAKTATLPEAAAEEINFLLDAHVSILKGSRLLRGVTRRVVDDRYNAEFAVQTELSSIAKQFEAMDDAYLSGRIQDIRDVGTRLIRNLTERKYQAFATLEAGTVILAEEISPADTALMDPRRVGGFATVLGGAESHTAIMARSLDLPAVLGVSELMSGVRSGQIVVVDGPRGLVIVDPTPDTIAAYERRRSELQAEREQLKTLITLAARTRDLVEVSLHANVELPREVESALAVGAEGVGLLRTEFMFMNRNHLPSEDEQYLALREIVEGMKGRPVTLRTIDVGGDKLADVLRHRIAESINPALGLRAIRLSLSEPRLLETQLSAMLRAGAQGPIRILLPMITQVAEVRQVRATLERVARRLKRRRVPHADPLPPVGVMIEVPGAALAADALALAADFFAIGTNDLTMYTLAIDRGDEQVAHLFDSLHPAVVRLIQFAAEAALRARIPVSVCGEMAGDPRYTALLLGLGVRELSMAPSKLLAVKRRIRMLDAMAATHRARMIVDQGDPGRIAALLDDFNEAG